MEYTFVCSLIVMEYMHTSETAANLSVLTDRELIRIILHLGKKKKKRLQPVKAHCSCFFLSWGCVLLVEIPGSLNASEFGSAISQRKSLCHTWRKWVSDTHTFLWWLKTCSVYTIWWWFSMHYSWTLLQAECWRADKNGCYCRDLQRSKFRNVCRHRGKYSV